MAINDYVLAKAVTRGWRRGQRFFPGDTVLLLPGEEIPGWAELVKKDELEDAPKARNDTRVEAVAFSERTPSTVAGEIRKQARKAKAKAKEGKQ